MDDKRRSEAWAAVEAQLERGDSEGDVQFGLARHISAPEALDFADGLVLRGLTLVHPELEQPGLFIKDTFTLPADADVPSIREAVKRGFPPNNPALAPGPQTRAAVDELVRTDGPLFGVIRMGGPPEDLTDFVATHQCLIFSAARGGSGSIPPLHPSVETPPDRTEICQRLEEFSPPEFCRSERP